MDFNKDANRMETKRQDKKNIYVVLYFKNENSEWYQLKLAIPKDKLEKQ